LTVTGSTRFYSEQDSAFLATVSGSRSSSDIAFNFRKIGEPSAGSRHTMIVEGTGGQDTNLYFGVNNVGSSPGATFAVKGNGSVNINMPSPTGNYAGLAVGGWISSYPSLLVRGIGTTSSTTSLLVQNANASASLIVKDDGQIQVSSTSVANPGYSFIDNTDTGLYMVGGTMGTVVDGQYSILYGADGPQLYSNTTNSITSANLLMAKIGSSHRMSIWINGNNDFQFEA
jgi:hypothetical protein